MYTGSYQVPPPTIMGSISKDIAMIDEVIGAGEIAIADHRSSYPTIKQFIGVVQEAKIGGLLGKKVGIVNIHLGEDGPPFQLIYNAVEENGIYYRQFLPTHCNRTREVFEDSKIYAKHGPIDITTSSYPYYTDSEVKPSDAFFEFLDAGVPIEHITFSSDSGGSLPLFDKNGEFVKIAYGRPDSLLNEILDIITRDETLTAKAIQTVTANPANILKLERKGYIKPGYDADIIVLNPERKVIRYLYALGQKIIENQ